MCSHCPDYHSYEYYTKRYDGKIIEMCKECVEIYCVQCRDCDYPIHPHSEYFTGIENTACCVDCYHSNYKGKVELKPGGYHWRVTYYPTGISTIAIPKSDQSDYEREFYNG